MSYLSSNDARRQNSTAEVDGFSTPAEELFLCTCHGKRWPLSMLKIENGGQRHCPNQANAQGGSIDRDMLRDYDRIEIERRAVEDAVPVTWPISPLEDIPCVTSLEPPQQILSLGVVTGTIVIHGTNLIVPDDLSLDASDPTWPPAGLLIEFPNVVVAADGFSASLTFLSPDRTFIPALPAPPFAIPTPFANLNLTYGGVVYESVFLLR